jgi:two-component system, NtrC family, sensor kinase
MSHTLGLNDITGLASALDANDPVTEMALVAKFTDFGVVVTDAHSRALWVNAGFEHLTGYTLAEVVGRVPGHLLQGPDTDPETVAFIRSKISAGEGFNADILNYRKDGTPYWLNIEVRAIRNGAGEVHRFIALESDITARKTAEDRILAARQEAEAFAEALAYSRQQLEMILHGADLGEWIWDIESREITVNHDWLGSIGHPIEPTGQLREILKHVDEAHRLRILEAGRSIGTATTGQLDVEFRLDGTGDPGTWLLARGRAVAFDDEGRPLRLMGTLLDISDRKHIEEQLKKERSLISNILANIPHAVYWKDVDGRYLGCNETFAAMVGLASPSEVIGTSDDDLFEPAVAQASARIANEVLTTATPSLDADEVMVGADGARRALLASRVPTRDDEGAVNGVLGVFTDVTAIKNLESQLAAISRLEAIGQLAAGIAHEINTPMQYIGDNIQFLRKAFERIDEVTAGLLDLGQAATHEYPDRVDSLLTRSAELKLDFLRGRIPRSIEQSLEGVEAVSRIVRAMKDFSNPGRETMQQVDLNEAVSTTLTVCRNEWKYIAEIETDFAPNLPLVPALAGELNQVLLNIVVNAAHAIEATRSPEDMGSISIRTWSDHKSVFVSITDDGGGIPAAIRDRIFDPFFTTKPVGKGSGQGLAISHQIVVTRHGGAIDVHSTPGVGTTFRIRLPLENHLAETELSA